MARIREALWRTDTRRGPPVDGVAAPRAYLPDEHVQAHAQVEEEVPFIEVGGPETPMEASPSVLATTLNPACRKPRQPAEQNAVPVSTGQKLEKGGEVVRWWVGWSEIAKCKLPDAN